MAQSDNSPFGQTLRWALLTVALLIVGIAVWQVRDVILLAFTAVLLTVMLTSPVRWLVRRRVPRSLAVVISLLGMAGLFVLLMALALPQIITQFGQLIDLIPQALVALEQRLADLDLPPGWDILPEDSQTIIEQLAANLGAITSSIFPQLFPIFGSVTSVVLSILIVGFMSMYFLFNPGMHERGLISLLPIRYRPRAWEIIAKLDRTMRGYLQAKATSMVLVGLGTGLGLYLLGVPFAPALGVITGLFSFVPNFGPLAALMPVLAVTIINAPDRVLWVIVLYYGIQLVESQFVGPLLVSHEINLPPVLVLISQIVFVVFFGFLGLLLSVPLIAIVQVLVQEIYIKGVLGDRGAEAPPAAAPELPVVIPEAARPAAAEVAPTPRPSAPAPREAAPPPRAARPASKEPAPKEPARPERAEPASGERASGEKTDAAGEQRRSPEQEPAVPPPPQPTVTPNPQPPRQRH